MSANLTEGYQVTILISNRITSQACEGTAENVVLTYVVNKVGPDGGTPFTGFVTNPQDYSAPPPETPDPPTDTTRTLFSNRGQQTVQTFGTAMHPPRVVTGISAVRAINRGGDYSRVVTVT